MISKDDPDPKRIPHLHMVLDSPLSGFAEWVAMHDADLKLLRRLTKKDWQSMGLSGRTHLPGVLAVVCARANVAVTFWPERP